MLLSLAAEHAELSAILKTPKNERTQGQLEVLNALAKDCCLDVCRFADAVFTTCITASSKWLRGFREKVQLTIIDEAGAVTLLESLIVWKGDTPLILVGDDNQLPPPVMSLNQDYENHKPVNAFGQQLKQSLLSALITNDWPCYQLTEQLRIDPGQWDLPGEICYDGKIKTWDQKTLSAEGAAFENLCQTLPGESPGSLIQSAPPGQSWPLLLDISNGFTFKQVDGTSRGNSFTIHHGLNLFSIWSLQPSSSLLILLSYALTCTSVPCGAKLYQGFPISLKFQSPPRTPCRGGRTNLSSGILCALPMQRALIPGLLTSAVSVSLTDSGV
jgi:hypothetical protein